MSASREASPGDEYFNDLSQQPSKTSDEPERRHGAQEETVNGQVSKPKRIACVLCRKRKLKCDGTKPSCGTCTRLQHDCSYDEVRRKSGPKRGYVKALEARLAQVETLLKTQDDQPAVRKNANPSTQSGSMAHEHQTRQSAPRDNSYDFSTPMEGAAISAEMPFQSTLLQPGDTGGLNVPTEEPFPWEMIGLGLDEPLPTQDVVNDLNQAYFEKIHPCLPMIHRPRYYAAMNLAPPMRPPICLRYAMWCSAASVVDRYNGLQDIFYQRARKYIQQDEMKGHGESMITIAHCQTWVLLATYEFKLMYFPRAWMSSGRSSRLGLMMGIHRIDGQGLDVKQCLPPPKDWTEREERRRTFWGMFCVDRYSSIGTGWPMTVEENDISSLLPGDERSYELNQPTDTMTLREALDPGGAPKLLSGFSGVILLACLFGHNLTHLHRPSRDENEKDLNGEFWKRHRLMDNRLLNISLTLPSALRIPNGLSDPNVVFMNMSIHTSVICLHQAAIFKADKNQMPARISAESKVRCVTAAAEIASIMRQISHMDLSSVNPFISFCLYVAARVFVQYLKSRRNDQQVRASLQFLLIAMEAIKKTNPLTESFLVQLDVDLEGAALEDLRASRATIEQMANNTFKYSVDKTGIMRKDTQPTYGNIGLAVYNDPSSGGNITQGTSNAYTYPEGDAGAGPAESTFSFPAATQFDLPNRQRSPISNQGSSILSQSLLPDMDTSPDDSRGSASDHHTPEPSSTQPQQYNPWTRTTNPYSPQKADPGSLSSLFGPNDVTFANDFDMQQYQQAAQTGSDQQQPGFVLPSSWIPEGTGFTSIHSAELSDVIGMSDADWNQMLGNMAGNMSEWDNEATQKQSAQGVPYSHQT